MTYTVANQIGQLMYLYDTVIVPELGGFEGKVQSASIDHIHGKIAPPKKIASFNPNLVTNDGVLINAIASSTGCSEQSAREEVMSFVQECQERFNAKEVVQIPKVGKLYANYNNKIEFIPEETNFFTNTYGLETVQFYPILRTAATLEDAGTFIPETAPIRRITKARSWMKYAIPAAVVLLLAVPLAMYMMGNNPDASEEVILQPVSEKRLNIKPKSGDSGTLDVVDANGDIIDTSALRRQLEQEQEVTEESNTTESVEEIPSKIGVIAIGVFGSKENVNRLVKKIYGEGFEPHLERKRRGTMVGIKFDMNTYNKEDMLKDVRSNFEKGAQFLKVLK